jgi:hypothetical protein
MVIDGFECSAACQKLSCPAAGSRAASGYRSPAPRGTILPFKVGGDGKPVEVRRGPATVIGDAGRIEATGDAESPGRRGW